MNTEGLWQATVRFQGVRLDRVPQVKMKAVEGTGLRGRGVVRDHNKWLIGDDLLREYIRWVVLRAQVSRIVDSWQEPR